MKPEMLVQESRQSNASLQNRLLIFFLLFFKVAQQKTLGNGFVRD